MNQMSLKSNTIDIISDSPLLDYVALVAVDDVEFDDERARYDAFLRKISIYAHFIWSGQLVERNPEYKGRPVKIVVLCTSPPANSMISIESLTNKSNQQEKCEVIVVDKFQFDALFGLN